MPSKADTARQLAYASLNVNVPFREDALLSGMWRNCWMLDESSRVVFARFQQTLKQIDTQIDKLNHERAMELANASTWAPADPTFTQTESKQVNTAKTLVQSQTSNTRSYSQTSKTHAHHKTIHAQTQTTMEDGESTTTTITTTKKVLSSAATTPRGTKKKSDIVPRLPYVFFSPSAISASLTA
jgi:hypothetical protein